MGRPHEGPVTQAQLTDQELAMIDVLVSTGLYGANREECVERLVAWALVNLVESAILNRGLAWPKKI
jgi:hypothetical protein